SAIGVLNALAPAMMPASHAAAGADPCHGEIDPSEREIPAWSNQGAAAGGAHGPREFAAAHFDRCPVRHSAGRHSPRHYSDFAAGALRPGRCVDRESAFSPSASARRTGPFPLAFAAGLPPPVAPAARATVF